MDGLDIRITPFSYYKDSTFFIGNKGRTAINPNIFIYVLNGIIGLFTGWRSVFNGEINVQKAVLAGVLHSPLF
ncbi:hypothetical protein [Alistipes senegalensis]|uniref:Uncharacterized protein n=1 Tax=Alistipes senegalensis JC50 TaxID=1033732 RepID=A0ABY5V9L4_9BACT|nr:hypothetical protein [Alistipes senegalensis]UEA86943.1 hypothetical protein LK406_14805 [Alistipes senegalensis]UWN65467.1 hypothetical protein NQ519_01140 [Alistipes senegalensis JC50]